MRRLRVFVYLLPVLVWAIPLQMNHQGMLKNAANQPLNGAYILTFSLFDGPTSGDSLLWTETHSAVPVVDGLYAVQLGQTNPLTPSVLSVPLLWLGVAVGGDPEMIPRIRVVSTPYAICALKVDSITVDNLKDLIQLWAITPDADGDGHTKFINGGDDCDDFDPSVYAGAPEVCDGKDNDCDHAIDEGLAGTLFRDADGDGYGNPTIAIFSCNPVNGYVGNGDDCDDTQAVRNPGAVEVCDGVDNNCNLTIDEGFNTTWFADNDNDGWGDQFATVISCTPVPGFNQNPGDCDDGDPSVNVGATEICDMLDNNCDGVIDPPGAQGCTNYWQDLDSDNYGDTYAGCYCVGNEMWTDQGGGDCDDNNHFVNPGAPEVCDGVDNDCDGTIDEGFACTTWFYDYDGDGYGRSEDSTCACGSFGEYTASQGGDCNDYNDGIHPGANEFLCNDGIDNDCDGDVDGADSDCP